MCARRVFYLLGFLVLYGICDECVAQDPGQDTNFPAGPQYLVTSGSRMFLRPIATPMLSLGIAPSAAEPAAEAAAAEEAQPVPAAGLLPGLLRVFYGGPEKTAPEVSAPVSEIEITPANGPVTLPASMVEVGVVELLDSQSLPEPGSGMDLGETAAFWKTHKPHAPRLYTNADVDRLHGE